MIIRAREEDFKQMYNFKEVVSKGDSYVSPDTKRKRVFLLVW